MNTQVIIANIIGLIAFVIATLAYHHKTKKMIFVTSTVADVLKLIHYIVLNAYSGMTTKVIAIIRNLAIIKQDKYKILKSKWILLIFVIAYIVLGVVTYNGIISICSVLAAFAYTTVSWNGNETRVRQVVILSETLWFIYNIYVKSYALALSNIVMIISAIIALYRNRNKIQEIIDLKEDKNG